MSTRQERVIANSPHFQGELLEQVGQRVEYSCYNAHVLKYFDSLGFHYATAARRKELVSTTLQAMQHGFNTTKGIQNV